MTKGVRNQEKDRESTDAPTLDDDPSDRNQELFNPEGFVLLVGVASAPAPATNSFVLSPHLNRGTWYPPPFPFLFLKGSCILAGAMGADLLFLLLRCKELAAAEAQKAETTK